MTRHTDPNHPLEEARWYAERDVRNYVEGVEQIAQALELMARQVRALTEPSATFGEPRPLYSLSASELLSRISWGTANANAHLIVGKAYSADASTARLAEIEGAK